MNKAGRVAVWIFVVATLVVLAASLSGCNSNCQNDMNGNGPNAANVNCDKK